MSAHFYSARKQQARLEISMWNWKLSGWPRLSGLERAAVPLWHINLYGELTVQHQSQAPSIHRAPSPSLWDSAAFVRFVFLHTFMKLWPRKVSHRDPALTNSDWLDFASMVFKATGTHSWFSLLIWTQLSCNYLSSVLCVLLLVMEDGRGDDCTEEVR